MSSEPEINFVIPLYNEAEVFQELVRRLCMLMDASDYKIEIILVDDGSTDSTRDQLTRLSKEDDRFTGVVLSRNFGHQIALTAGLEHVNATSAVMILDGDLQDPPELLSELHQKLNEGYDVVYAIRQKRKEIFLKRLAYQSFYRILKRISYINIPLDTGDFCLISRRVVDELNAMPEESRFIRGMRTWIGFKQVGITYERPKREEGDSKYSFKLLFKLALNGIFNFSEFPIKMLIRVGGIIMSIASIYLIYTLIQRFIFDTVESGFTALLFVIILFGGLQLVALGILGEYVLRIFFQVKNRPLFVIDKVIRHKENSNE